MASLKYFLRNQGEDTSIYVSFRSDIKHSSFYLKKKTREKINSNDWNPKKGEPKQKKSLSKNDFQRFQDLNETLDGLKYHILNKYKARAENDNINSSWLTTRIEEYYNGGTLTESKNYLSNFLDYYENEVIKLNIKNITTSAIKKEKQICRILREFQEDSINRIRLKDFDDKMFNQFVHFMREQKKYKDGTVTRYSKYVKTIFKHGQRDFEINPLLFSATIPKNNSKKYVVYLKPEELEKVENAILLDKNLQATKDWFIIGCYTGQRASDLFRMSKEMISTTEKGSKIINLRQTKTKSLVQIPIHPKVNEILQKRGGEFPPITESDTFIKEELNISSITAKFNLRIKKIFKSLNLDREVMGCKYNKETKEKEIKMFPLYEVIASHNMRRTFASQYYGVITTPKLMYITGHKKESMLLEYIGKKDEEFADDVYEIWNSISNNIDDSQNLQSVSK